MNRYNIFYLIHKGLRAMLYDAALILQQTDFAVASEGTAALAKVNDVLFAFDRHTYLEDRFIIPVVEAYEPEIAMPFKQEHEQDRRLGGRLKNLLIIYENQFLPEERIASGSAITKSFTEFLIFNLEHMAKEEMLLNHALWRLYTNEQIMAIHQKLIAKISPAEMEHTSKWMMRAISAADAIRWLKTVRQSAPEFIFNDLMDIAQDELSETRFEVVRQALKQEIMVI